MDIHSIDHFIPYSQEAEEATLGACLLDNRAYLSCAALLTADDFFFIRHSYIWEALTRLKGRNEPVDYLMAVEELKSMGKLDEIGGPAYITRLINNTPTAVHAEAYAALVQRMAVRRRLLEAADEMKALATDEGMPVEEMLAKSIAGLASVNMSLMVNRPKTWSEHVGDVFSEMEQKQQSGERLGGLASGYKALDDLTGGWHKTDLILIAGRPGMGKTAWMCSQALLMARRAVRAGIISLEMPAKQIIKRMAAIDSGISVNDLRRGNLTQAQWADFVTSAGLISELPLYIDERKALRPEQIKAQVAIWQMQHGLDIVFIDHLQKFGDDRMFKGESRLYQQRSYDIAAMKDMAGELDIPVICASQLSRNIEKRQDRRPVLSDLRDSGKIEEEADIIAFLYRDVIYNAATEQPNQADMNIAKHRNGPPGLVTFHFNRALTEFTESKHKVIDLQTIGRGTPAGEHWANE